MSQVREHMGEKWPEKGLVEHEAFEETKALLMYMRDEIAEQCFGDDEAAKAEFLRGWPFETRLCLSEDSSNDGINGVVIDGRKETISKALGGEG